MVELNPDIWSKLSATTKLIIGPIILSGTLPHHLLKTREQLGYFM